MLHILPLPGSPPIRTVRLMATHEKAQSAMKSTTNEGKVGTHSRRWDAGEIGCGHLVIGLRRELDQISPGELLHVVAMNSGAPVDIPAWCRMTGHMLVSARHPNYVLRRKGTHPCNSI